MATTKKRRDGSYIEQGHGSVQTRRATRSRPTEILNAEPDFEKNFARMQKELAEADERRAAERGDNR